MVLLAWQGFLDIIIVGRFDNSSLVSKLIATVDGFVWSFHYRGIACLSMHAAFCWILAEFRRHLWSVNSIAAEVHMDLETIWFFSILCQENYKTEPTKSTIRLSPCRGNYSSYSNQSSFLGGQLPLILAYHNQRIVSEDGGAYRGLIGLMQGQIDARLFHEYSETDSNPWPGNLASSETWEVW